MRPMRTRYEQFPDDDGLDGFETRPSRRSEAGGGARFRLSRGFVRHYRQLAVVGSLVFATLVCVGLLVGRLAHTRGFGYIGLSWNLFLAWIPMVAALVAYNSSKQRSWLSWIVVPVGAFVWLIFLPNAPYLVTDIIHLQPTPEISFWYDLLMIVAFAWTGSFLGLVSLFLMQEVIRRAVGGVISWLFVLGAVGLSGFGIYLGRFLRWNSWDIFFHPIRLSYDVLTRLRHPIANFQTFVFTAIIAFIILSTYLMLVAVTQLRQEAGFETQPGKRAKR
jgi:uncharacterized membrane protein